MLVFILRGVSDFGRRSLITTSWRAATVSLTSLGELRLRPWTSAMMLARCERGFGQEIA